MQLIPFWLEEINQRSNPSRQQNILKKREKLTSSPSQVWKIWLSQIRRVIRQDLSLQIVTPLSHKEKEIPLASGLDYSCLRKTWSFPFRTVTDNPSQYNDKWVQWLRPLLAVSRTAACVIVSSNYPLFVRAFVSSRCLSSQSITSGISVTSNQFTWQLDQLSINWGYISHVRY